MVTCPRCDSDKVTLHNSPSQYHCRKCGKYFTVGPEINKVSILEPLSKLEVDLVTTRDRINLVPIGDIHLGAAECDWDKVEREVEYILTHQDHYTIGMGDYCNFANRNSNRKGPSVYADALSPMQQYEKLYNLLKPLADQKKLLGLLKGNHEEWIYEDSGIDIVALLCQALDVPYLGSACDLVIGVNEIEYTAYALHGSSHAKTSASKMGSLYNATRDILADIYLQGHVHQVAASKASKWIGGKETKSYYILTGSFLKWQFGYAQKWGLSPNPTGVAKISLFANKKDVHVTI